ncbi:MAG: decarboxylating NADP(+)-dependent phosphogluconate dehydrogenase, partial [Sedimentisphaerales bacterium]
KPRKVMLMVKAGQAVDDFIEQLLPHLENGDIIIDGGNSHFPDTIRRTKYVESKGKLYIGTGVSGGEEGALRGPSIMPGGSPAAWTSVKPIFQAICAKTDKGEPCCEWVGENGAGHFVKMVHNGIEYGDMQLICETYHLMREGLGLSNAEMHKVLAQWNQGELNSYLIEITRDILAYKDEQENEVIDLILDTAGQKGTGKWTVVTALDSGQPLTLIGEAVFGRCLSALKDERVKASQVLKGPKAQFKGDKAKFIDDLRKALYASKIISYAQGYQLMRAAAKEYGWNLNYGGVALMWRGGCIIRSAFLGEIKKAFDKNPNLENLLLDPFFRKAITKAQASWRRVVTTAVKLGIPIPAISAAMAYYDGYRHDRLPANLLQAQRDYFGAHTYERVDKPRGEFFHTNWTGRGGDTSSSAYTA